MESRFEKKDGVLYLHVMPESSSDRIVMGDFARQMEGNKTPAITWGHVGNKVSDKGDEIGLFVFSNKTWQPPEKLKGPEGVVKD